MNWRRISELMGSTGQPAPFGAPNSLLRFSTDRLTQLCASAGYGEQTREVVSTFARLISPWAHADRSKSTPWVSDISDDNTPIEFSVTIANDGSEIRVLLEPQGDEPTIESYRIAALEFFERLEREFGVSLDRFRKVKDLFAPEGMQGPFAIWTSAVFRRHGPPTFKAYFNPQALGVGRADALVEEGLCRLGFPRSWGSVGLAGTRRGPELDEIKYFALDLFDADSARVKVYVRHHHATPDDLEIAASAATSYLPGEALEFARAMGGERSRLNERATFTCSAFVEGEIKPTATTLYVPVCAYGRHDGEVRRRLIDYLKDSPATSAQYDKIINGYKNRPLEDGTGMQSWAAIRRLDGDARLTVYLATEARHVFPVGDVPAATPDRLTFDSASEVLERTSTYELKYHPFVQRMLREEDRTLMASMLLDALGAGEEGYLMALLRTVKDEELGRTLARLPRTASRVLRKLPTLRISPPPEELVSSTSCGWRFADDLGRLIEEGDALGNVCALMVIEVAARQLQALMASNEVFAREPLAREVWDSFDGESMQGDESDPGALARLLPTDSLPLDSVRLGTLHAHRALWAMLNDLYAAWAGEDVDESCFRIKAAPRVTDWESEGTGS